MKRIAVAATTVALLLAGCGDSDPEPKVLERTEADDGTRVALRVGDQLVLRLGQCVGCGYTWEVVGELDPDVLELTSAEDEERARTDPPTAGGQTTHVMTFTAEDEGEVTLAVGNVPPGDRPPDEVLTYEVRVRG